MARVDGVIGDANAQKYWYHTDHIGSVRAVSNQAGQVVWKADYLAFGSRYGKEGTFEEERGFGGKEYDSDTGLYYFNARWYDSELGRFISEDPVADPNNPNLYSYCRNNPLAFTDLTGLASFGNLDIPTETDLGGSGPTGNHTPPPELGGSSKEDIKKYKQEIKDYLKTFKDQHEKNEVLQVIRQEIIDKIQTELNNAATALGDDPTVGKKSESFKNAIQSAKNLLGALRSVSGGSGLHNFENPGGGNQKDPTFRGDLNLVKIKGADGEYQLDFRVAKDYLSMLLAAREYGIGGSLLLLTSGYRSKEHQEKVLDGYIYKYIEEKKQKGITVTYEEGYKYFTETERSVAVPGSHPHGSGRVIDLYFGVYVTAADRKGSNNRVLETKAYDWLSKHCNEYGFYVLTKNDKIHEAWHYSYNPAVK